MLIVLETAMVAVSACPTDVGADCASTVAKSERMTEAARDMVGGVCVYVLLCAVL